jgi:hypothetical protein
LIEYAHGRLKPSWGNAGGGGKSAVHVVEDHQPEQGNLVVHQPLRTGKRQRRMPVESSLDSEGTARTSSSDDKVDDTNIRKSNSGDSSDEEVESDEEDNNGKREDYDGVGSEEEADDDEESRE